MRMFPSRLLPAIAAAVLFIALSTLTRAALALRPEAAMLPAAELARSFAVGLTFDFVTAIYAAAPLALWLVLAPDRLARHPAYRAATAAWFLCAAFLLLLLAAAEWLFWEEFGA